VAKRKKREKMFLYCHINTKCGLLFKMAIGQNLQYEGRALFFFIYLYNICTDFFLFLLKMKDKLTSGMPENLGVILFACLVFGDLKK
jgi:hypothetical protein